MIALDSNVFIYHLEGNDEFGSYAEAVLKAVENGQVSAITSELTFAEALGFPGMTEDQAAIAQREMITTTVKFVKLTTPIVMLAASLRRSHTLRTPDAIHLATALTLGATHFVSNDWRLLKQEIPDIKLVPLTHIKELISPSGDNIQPAL